MWVLMWDSVQDSAAECPDTEPNHGPNYMQTKTTSLPAAIYALQIIIIIIIIILLFVWVTLAQSAPSGVLSRISLCYRGEHKTLVTIIPVVFKYNCSSSNVWKISLNQPVIKMIFMSCYANWISFSIVFTVLNWKKTHKTFVNFEMLEAVSSSLSMVKRNTWKESGVGLTSSKNHWFLKIQYSSNNKEAVLYRIYDTELLDLQYTLFLVG